MPYKSFNEVILLGGLGRDPDLKATPKGKSYCVLALATTDGSKDYQQTNWHKVILWGTQAENAAKYLKKGSQVLVKGNLTYNDWTDKNGQKHRDAEIQGFKIIYLSSPSASEERQPVEDERDILY